MRLSYIDTICEAVTDLYAHETAHLDAHEQVNAAAAIIGKLSTIIEELTMEMGRLSEQQPER